MGGFPQLPSSYNPYLYGAERAESGAAAVYNATQRAKEQQALRDRQATAAQNAQYQRDFQNQLSMGRMGVVPSQVQVPQLTSPEMNTIGSGAFGAPIFRESAKPVLDEQGQTIPLPGGIGVEKKPYVELSRGGEPVVIGGKQQYTRGPNPVIQSEYGGRGQYIRGPATAIPPTKQNPAGGMQPGEELFMPDPGALAESRRPGKKLDATNSYVPPPDSPTAKYLHDVFGRDPNSKDPIPFTALSGMGTFARDLQAAADAVTKRGQTGKVTQSLHQALIEHAGIDVPVGSDIPYERIESLARAGRAPTKPKKTMTHTQTTDDMGTVHLRFWDEDGLLASEHSFPKEGKATKTTAGGAKGPTPSLMTGIEARKNTRNAKAYAAYVKATTDQYGLGVDPAAKEAARKALISAYQANQSAYEAEIKAATGNKVNHDTWADELAAKGGPPPAAGGDDTDTTTDDTDVQNEATEPDEDTGDGGDGNDQMGADTLEGQGQLQLEPQGAAPAQPAKQPASQPAKQPPAQTPAAPAQRKATGPPVAEGTFRRNNRTGAYQMFKGGSWQTVVMPNAR